MNTTVTKIAKIEDTIQVQTRLLALKDDFAKGKVFECTIKPFRERRSLDANAYFHVMVARIAAHPQIKSGADEVKVKLNLDYGTPEDLDGENVVMMIPKKVDAVKVHPYPKFIGDYILPNGEVHSQYLLYKQTHALDRKEMAALIDGVISEAKDLGIETKTPAEVAEMMSLWGAK